MFDEAQWSALCTVMGEPEWSRDARFATAAARRVNERQLNELIERWTSDQHADWLAESLLEAGVPAGKVNDARDVVTDEHLRRRGFWTYLDHPEVGSTLYNRAPMVLSGTPLRVETPAPSIGQHTREVLAGTLGYSESEIEDLASSEVLI